MIQPVNNFVNYTIHNTPQIINILATCAQKVAGFAGKYLNLFQWACLGTYGLKEILFDRIKPVKQKIQNLFNLRKDRVKECAQAILVKNDQIGKIPFNVAHGTIYAASGVAGGIAALNHLNFINIGSAVSFPLECVGNGLFGIASFLTVIQNVRLYIAATKIEADASKEEIEAVKKIKISAIMGIISGLNYIVTAALLLCGVGATIALVFGLIGLVTGCIKILYDYYTFRKS